MNYRSVIVYGRAREVTPDPALEDGVPVPDYVRNYRR